MKAAELPANELDRLQSVKKLGILDTKPEERFDVITREAVAAFKVPIATITVMDKEREWYKSCQGLNVREVSRELSFCAHAMLSRNIFVVEDTLRDPRFADNPMVTGEPHIRFYAGVALTNEEGHHIGVFCIKDTKPRTLTPDEIVLLMDFAQRALVELTKN